MLWKGVFLNMTYDLLLDEALQLGLDVKEKPLVSCDGRIKGTRIAIRQDIDTRSRKACVLAEELGHYYTSVGNILDQRDMNNARQELRARKWAYEKIIPIADVIRAANAGCRLAWEFAEFLDVDEEFAVECLRYYGIL